MLSEGLPDPPAVPRWLAAALIAAFLFHAGLLAFWLSRLIGAREPILLGAGDLRHVVGLTVAAMLLAVVAFPRRPRQAASVLVLAAACAFVGIGVVATVAVMAFSAHVVGTVFLDWSERGTTSPVAPRPTAAIRMLVGTCLWIGVIAATLPLPVHTGPLYVMFVAGSLLAFPGATLASLVQARQWLADDARRDWPERACIALAAAVAIVHLIVVAKPEVGYDASTMHLQFAELVAHFHRFDFDVGRYAWAVMPMGADDAYLAAYLLAGETAARLLNLLFGALLCAIVYAVVGLQASRTVALVSACLLASTPLWFLESGTLYVEFAWTAFLAGAVAATLSFVARPAPAAFAAAVMCCAGAMACKAVGVFVVVPLALVLLHALSRARTIVRAPLVVVSLVAIVIAAWPYANAWVRTGNPVFPFMNALFASPLFPSAASFNNPLYNAPLSLLTPYELVMASGRFIEGFDGAAGIQWLLLFPLALFGLFTRERRRRRAIFALAIAFAVAVYVQQSYLRYLLPAFVLVAILAGWALGDTIRGAAANGALVVAATTVALVNVWLMPSASWPNTTLCLRCAVDADARHAYVARYGSLRLVADYLNRNLPDARVGFFVLNGAAPSGFIGYSRAANWHDSEVFEVLSTARSVDDVAGVVRRFQLTHAVFVNGSNALDRVLLEYRDRRTTPIAYVGKYVVAAIRPEATPDDDARAAASASR